MNNKIVLIGPYLHSNTLQAPSKSFFGSGWTVGFFSRYLGQVRPGGMPVHFLTTILLFSIFGFSPERLNDWMTEFLDICFKSLKRID